MTKSYNATLELRRKANTLGGSGVDDLVAGLSAYYPAAGASPRGWLEVTITLPGESLIQAMVSAAAVVSTAAQAETVSCLVMTTEEFHARRGTQE